MLFSILFFEFVNTTPLLKKNTIATALDPILDVAEGSLPVASAIDVWVRDPPAVSILAARGA